ncbi:hypothetical protein BDZ91DRAFT_760875 [Kalaharituber pfeilii]|nr:hypothetical protein BDZ91DRAFT_760875 [Kalaharituber pfeilii]
MEPSRQRGSLAASKSSSSTRGNRVKKTVKKTACPFCDEICSDKDSYVQHLVAFHNVNWERYQNLSSRSKGGVGNLKGEKTKQQNEEASTEVEEVAHSDGGCRDCSQAELTMGPNNMQIDSQNDNEHHVERERSARFGGEAYAGGEWKHPATEGLEDYPPSQTPTVEATTKAVPQLALNKNKAKHVDNVETDSHINPLICTDVPPSTNSGGREVGSSSGHAMAVGESQKDLSVLPKQTDPMNNGSTKELQSITIAVTGSEQCLPRAAFACSSPSHVNSTMEQNTTGLKPGGPIKAESRESREEARSTSAEAHFSVAHEVDLVMNEKETLTALSSNKIPQEAVQVVSTLSTKRKISLATYNRRTDEKKEGVEDTAIALA